MYSSDILIDKKDRRGDLASEANKRRSLGTATQAIYYESRYIITASRNLEASTTQADCIINRPKEMNFAKEGWAAHGGSEESRVGEEKPQVTEQCVFY